MAEEQKNTNVNPATPVTQNQNIPSAGVQPGPQTGQVPGQKTISRNATLVQNPPKDEPVAEDKNPEVPQSTLDEMEAGRRALARNRPASIAREQAQARSAEAAKA